MQEIYDLYQTFIQKERPAMEEDEADDWEGNIILALGVDYGTCNLCGNIKKCELSEGFLYIEAEELALITDFRVLLKIVSRIWKSISLQKIQKTKLM